VSTLTVILSLPWRACTNTARSGAPSGPVTVPDMLAASAGAETMTAATTNETDNAAMDATQPARTIARAAAVLANDRMAFPRVGLV
jgi:hypothetical protein